MTAALATSTVGSALPALAKGGEAVKAGPVGLGVILLLCIVCYFLFKSMSGHLRKVREGFPKNPPSATDGVARAVAEPRKPAIEKPAVDLRKPDDTGSQPDDQG